MSKSSVIKCQRKLVKLHFYDLMKTPLKLNLNLLAIHFKLEIHSVIKWTCWYCIDCYIWLRERAFKGIYTSLIIACKDNIDFFLGKKMLCKKHCFVTQLEIKF